MSKGMRKKIAVLLTAAIAAAGLSACGGNGSDNSGGGQDTESKAGTSKEETKPILKKMGAEKTLPSACSQGCPVLTAELS